MNFRTIYKIIGLLVFLISFGVLHLTVQPSVSFWDCGEFIAAGYYLQVPHPPGAPFFLLIGRLFSMIPFTENIALRFNYISVLSSALSVFFLYLIAVKLIENYRGKTPKNLLDALATYISAAIGALSLSFSDTFWFSAVEAEVYAASTFLFAAITYLMMRWQERADSKDNEKYILLIAYLIGLSTGVHLMSVLAIISVVMIILFKKYVDDEKTLKKTGYILLIHAAVILLIAFVLWGGQKSSNPPSPEEYQSFDSRFKLIIAGLSAIVIGTMWKTLLSRNSIYLAMIVGGVALFATYPGVVKLVPGLMESIAGNRLTVELFTLIVIFGILGYAVYYSVKKNKPTLNLIFLSAIFILLGFTTYTQVIIRANHDLPMNENQPDDFTELVSYLNREQYGDFPTFKRRFASESHQRVVYDNYSTDLEFWWKYQMNHMMTRYLLWNYAGRESWIQDAGANIYPFNALGNALGKIFNVRFAGEAKDSLYGIPFLLGLLGIYFHFRKDWKMASIFMVLFVFMGYLTAFYQNQQQPQPRERDYFYAGAFFVYSIWIAIGVRGFVDIVMDKFGEGGITRIAVPVILLLGIVFVPVRMLQANYHTHDRSQNWVPWDYSYNLLQSCAPNSILFTNGDNDTFPLWYLQDVEGVRRDVRIANLSLLNTPWYIKQLKNLEPYGAKKVAIRFSDVEIERLGPSQWEPQMINVPVPPDAYKEYGVSDSASLNAGKISWFMNNTTTYGNYKIIRVQDIMVKEIIEANKWERPVYFAVTCSEDSKIGLSDYLKMEGMALKLVPEKRTGSEFVNEPVLRKQLFDEPDDFSMDYRPGFKFRGLNDKSIFFDENHERLTQNYRNSFIRLALYYIGNGNQKDKAVEVLDLMEKKMPRSIMPVDYRYMFDIGNIYYSAGGIKQYTEIAKEVEKEALKAIEDNPSDASSYYNPYRILMEIYQKQNDYDNSIKLLKKLQLIYPNDPSLQDQIDKLNAMKNSTNVPQNSDTGTIK